MSNVLHRVTKVYRRSVDTSLIDPAEWIVNPDLSAVKDLPAHYWKIDGDIVTAQNDGEKIATDAQRKQHREDAAVAEIDQGLLKIVVDALVEVINTKLPRENAITKTELREAVRVEVRKLDG